MKQRLTILCMLVGFAMNPAFAELYFWVDEHGGIHFTDSPPEAVEAQQVKLEINSYDPC
jgi:hypothetical protein